MKKSIKILSLSLAIVFVFGVLPAATLVPLRAATDTVAWADTVQVTGSTPADVQAAIDAAGTTPTVIALTQDVTFTEAGTITVAEGQTIEITSDGGENNKVDRAGIAGDSAVITNNGTLYLSGITVTGGSGVNGGGVYNTGTLYVDGGTEIIDNMAQYGGGIYNNQGTINLTDAATIFSNGAEGDGGGIWTSDLTSVNVTSPDVVFGGNIASVSYLLTDPALIAIHNTYIHTTNFSLLFTYAYNNRDINYTDGAPVVIVAFIAISYNATASDMALANLPSKNFVIGQPYGDLPTIARPGYTFDGWYTKPTGGTKVDSTTIVTATTDHTLYAHWTAVQNTTIPVTGVALDKVADTLAVGATDTLTAAVAPDNATNQAVTWSSSDTAIATVDANGLVTAVAPGAATITVTTVDGAVTAACMVTVSPPPAEIIPVTGVALDKVADTLTVGATDTLTAAVAPDNATNQAVTWSSSDTAIATVDANGLVTAVAPGAATITVTTADGAVTAACMVTVSPPPAEIIPVTGVTLSKIADTLTVGATDTLTAAVAPDNATNTAVTWSSSDTAIATVDANGLVTAVAPGAATITVTTADGAVTAACAVTVSVPVTGVTLNKTADFLAVGATDTLSATVAPDNATNQAVAWSSSNTAIAAVDANGKVTAVAPNTVIITATTVDGGKTATCAVTVSVPVTGVALNKSTDALAVGTTDTLSAAVAPDNATNQAVAWSSSNTAIAAVDANGKVTAVAPGAATITVTTADGGKTAACAVKVSVPVTGVALNKTAASLTVGTTDTLTATIAPDNATNKTIAWSSSDAAVAAVDASGKITALTPGAATITVTTADGGKTASCAVTVIRVYTITVTAGTGGAVYGGGKFNAGASVTLTAVPRNGDVFDGWYENRVKVSGAGAVYTFTAAADRALEARFAYKNPYSDVSASDWFYTDVQYATEVNLMNGTGGNLFEPNEPITRAMMATVLWRMAGSPALGDPSGFTDVPAKQWYTAAVSWAAANNIVFGYGNKLFGPNDLCTRQDMAVIFSRYIVLKRIALPAGAPKTFGDAADISGYAKSAVDQLTAAGILLGRPNNSFDPAGTATRAEAAAVLHRFSEAIK